MPESPDVFVNHRTGDARTRAAALRHGVPLPRPFTTDSPESGPRTPAEQTISLIEGLGIESHPEGGLFIEQLAVLLEDAGHSEDAEEVRQRFAPSDEPPAEPG